MLSYTIVDAHHSKLYTSQWRVQEFERGGGGGGILKAIFLAFQFLGGVLLVTQQVDWQWCSGSGATGAYSILYDGATLWNTLDKNIVHAQSLIDFKRMLQTWGGVTCSCMVCKSCCLNNM